VRIVLDTNVLLSAILFGGTPGRILDAWRAGRVELVMSPDIVDEYVRVGERLNGRYPDVEIQPVVALVVQNATIVPSAPLPGAVCDDPDDDKFLACALASGTETVVSGDKKLRAVSGYEGINVLTPRQLVDRCL
jgi:putative PIN family toxin of toxin-antitoxin system